MRLDGQTDGQKDSAKPTGEFR